MDLAIIVTILTVLVSFFTIIYVLAYYFMFSRYEHFRRFEKIIILAVLLFALSIILSPFYSVLSMLVGTTSLLLFFAAFYIEFKELAYFHYKKTQIKARHRRRNR